MSRISIEVTPEEHQLIKACAALSGKTLKEFVLERVLNDRSKTPPLCEKKAQEALEAFLETRLQSANQGKSINKSVTAIFTEVRNEENPHS